MINKLCYIYSINNMLLIMIFLQLNPDLRIDAPSGLKHKYFQSLPKQLYDLPDGK